LRRFATKPSVPKTIKPPRSPCPRVREVGTKPFWMGSGLRGAKTLNIAQAGPTKARGGRAKPGARSPSSVGPPMGPGRGAVRGRAHPKAPTTFKENTLMSLAAPGACLVW
jgi:hypothetical protein